MQKLATLVILIGMLGAIAPQGFTQEKESQAEEQRERRQTQVQKDVPADLQRARQALENAQRELQAAGDQWGGHRVAAMTHVGQALGEIKKAETYARQHKLVK
jgi:Tfp pilus assembly protein PilV